MSWQRLVAVVGMPRSGTSWVGQIVDSSPEVLFRMSPLFSYRFKNRLREGAGREAWVELLEEAYQAEDDFLVQRSRRAAGEYPTFDEKQASPPVLLLKFNRFPTVLEDLLSYFDELKILAVVRHPCGAIHSWLTAPGEFPAKADPLEQWRTGEAKKSDWGDVFGFEDWKAVTRLHLRLAKEHPERVAVESYEALVEAPLEGARRLLSFFELPFTEQTRHFVEASHQKKVAGDYSVFKDPAVKDRWREELQPEIREAILEELTGTDLERFL